MLLLLLLHRLLLRLFLSLLLHCLLLLLLLRLRLRRGLLLAVVVIVAAADQGDRAGAKPRASRGTQQRPPAVLPSLHPLPIVSVAHSNPFRLTRSGAKRLLEVCLRANAFATLVSPAG
ncbi:MAG: hypothetical protein F4088_06730 [Chloroflexi bacterium]|nr:hypothetical protein [Chloroflexota bacterium]MYJ58538.1 hypothetical protein [Chloroflexota bacterium]